MSEPDPAESTLYGVLAFITQQKARVYPSDSYWQALDDVEVELQALAKRGEARISELQTNAGAYDEGEESWMHGKADGMRSLLGTPPGEREGE